MSHGRRLDPACRHRKQRHQQHRLASDAMMVVPSMLATPMITDGRRPWPGAATASPATSDEAIDIG
ncbi:hypothetical protein [Caballeronia sp.]|uniref:hypothetical protein n=1 Tax=Caballeronia sp. TaxID=1931223 RepID=UPI003C68C0BF